mgnify:CR=1 FL=1
MTQTPPGPASTPQIEPKFARCRVCHEHFYADTVAEARQACRAHAEQQHPDWGETVCFCPD